MQFRLFPSDPVADEGWADPWRYNWDDSSETPPQQTLGIFFDDSYRL